MRYKEEVLDYILTQKDKGIATMEIAEELKIPDELCRNLYLYQQSIKNVNLTVQKGAPREDDNTVSIEDLKKGWYKKNFNIRTGKLRTELRDKVSPKDDAEITTQEAEQSTYSSYIEWKKREGDLRVANSEEVKDDEILKSSIDTLEDSPRKNIPEEINSEVNETKSEATETDSTPTVAENRSEITKTTTTMKEVSLPGEYTNKQLVCIKGVSRSTTELVVKAYTESAMSMNDIVSDLKVSVVRVRNILGANNVKIRNISRCAPVYSIREIKERYSEGEAVEKLAYEFGCTAKHIKQVVDPQVKTRKIDIKDTNEDKGEIAGSSEHVPTTENKLEDAVALSNTISLDKESSNQLEYTQSPKQKATTETRDEEIALLQNKIDALTRSCTFYRGLLLEVFDCTQGITAKIMAASLKELESET